MEFIETDPSIFVFIKLVENRSHLSCWTVYATFLSPPVYSTFAPPVYLHSMADKGSPSVETSVETLIKALETNKTVPAKKKDKKEKKTQKNREPTRLMPKRGGTVKYKKGLHCM